MYLEKKVFFTVTLVRSSTNFNKAKSGVSPAHLYRKPSTNWAGSVKLTQIWKRPPSQSAAAEPMNPSNRRCSVRGHMRGRADSGIGVPSQQVRSCPRVALH